jgi:hypothetical protein
MPRRTHPTLVAVALGAILVLLAAVPVAAAPADGAPPPLVARLAAWLGQLGVWPSPATPARQTASQDTIPGIDPDGVPALPPGGTLVDPDTASTQQAAGDGETIPGIDPNG